LCGAAVVVRAGDRTEELAPREGAATLPVAGPEAETPAEDLAVPGYQILGVLGRGGMAVVYQARQIELCRLVALKMILAGAHAGPSELARFHREAEAIARLQHPHIVEIYDMGEYEGCPFLALEYLDGGSLAQQLDGNPLPARLAATLVLKLARAVQAAHRAGIIHRDLKPANVLLSFCRDSQGRALPCGSRLNEAIPKIADFGLAKRLDDAQGQTQSGTILGTPGYMAPEQASGKSGAIGPATDIYALGAILYECLTGRPPFSAETPLDAVLTMLSREPAAPRTLAPGCPRDLETVCLKCLHKEPAERYTTAEELADDLGRFLAGEPVRARRLTRPERLIRWVRRRPLRAALLVLLLGALIWGGVRFGPGLYLRAANRGLLVVESPDSAVSVRLRAEGRPDATAAAGQTVTLPAGEYALALEGNAGGWELTEERMTLPRGERRVVHVRPTAEGVLRRLEGHAGPVHGLAVSPDGRLALSASGYPEGDETLRLWDLGSGKEVRRFEGHKGQVMCVAFALDGRRAVSGGTDATARLWDVATGQELRTFRGHTQELSNVAFSPDGQQLLTGSHDGSVRLWDIASGEQVGLFDDHHGGVSWVAFTPDGRQAASSAFDNTVRLWDVASGLELRRFTADGQATECAAVSPDGKLVAAPGFDRTIRLWDLTTGRLARRLLGHGNVVSTVAFSPDGRRLVSGSMDRTVRLWDVASGAQLHIFEDHADGIRAVAFAPDGWRVLSGGGGAYDNSKWQRGSDFAIRVWGLPHALTTPTGPLAEPAVEVRRFENRNARGVSTAVVSPDGRWLAADGPDSVVRLWDLATGAERRRLLGHTAKVWGVAWSTDSRRILTGSDDGSVRLWDAQTGRELVRWLGHQGRVWSVALSPDGRRALSGGADRTVRLWDLASGQELARFQGTAGQVRCVAFAPDGRTALSCSSDETPLRLWDLGDLPQAGANWQRQLALALATGPAPPWAVLTRPLGPAVEIHKPLRLLEGHARGVQSVAFSPDGRRAVSGSQDGTVRLWEVETGKQERKFEGHSQSVECVAFSSDGRRVLSGSGDGVALCWEADDGRELGFCSAHAHAVTSLGSAPGGLFVTSSERDPVLRLWQLPELGKAPLPALELAPNAAPPPTAPNEVVRFAGHRNGVSCVAVSPDGRQVLTGSGLCDMDGQIANGSENELRLWDVQTGQELRRFRGHTKPVLGVVFSRDGKQALSGGLDGTVRWWDLAGGRELRAISNLGEVRVVAWLGEGRTALAGNNAGLVRILDVAEGKVVREFAKVGTVWDLALSPDGRRIVVGTDQVVQLGDIETGQWLKTYAGPTKPVRSVSFLAGDKRILACSEDGTLRQWDATTGQSAGEVLRQTSGIVCASVTPDGRHAVTGAWDGVIRLWDLQAARQQGAFVGHALLVDGVAFTPDLRHVLSGSLDKTARLWRLP
jgi:WD40 repeat protein